ncbi:hypothetical protein SAMN05660199_00276 [Klenkia soli]|uniref:Uncharacterized protein n=1 Tax=Klenkia soli TaxID=1052260 RepID=A0A1H0CDS8_9ACTN|nr:hypothetical protein [Klenkia soli]SDN55966.1 hypothetical protein SAMN05660199_00276 [Klenkia soli]
MTAGWWAAAPAADLSADAHLLHAIDGALAGTGRRAVLVQTHVDRRHVVAATTVSWQLDGGGGEVEHDALAAALGGPVTQVDDGGAAGGALVEAPRAGRLVRFPGSADVRGEVPVDRLLARTAIDAVVGVGAPVGPGDVVDTLDGHLRPQRRDGAVELLVEPSGPGRWRPVEIADPHRCCGGHA